MKNLMRPKAMILYGLCLGAGTIVGNMIQHGILHEAQYFLAWSFVFNGWFRDGGLG